MDSPTSSVIGTVLSGRYRLDSKLGSGGMSTVYLATDETLDRPVAIKLLHAEISDQPDQLERFRREARAAARLSHPNLVGWKVSVYPPKGSTQQPMTFYMDVTLSGSGEGRRWRVSNWSPASMLSSASGGPAGAQQGSNPFAIDRQAGADLESRVNPLWLLLAFVPLAFVVLVVGAKGVRDWRRTAAVERDYRSTSNPS